MDKPRCWLEFSAVDCGGRCVASCMNGESTRTLLWMVLDEDVFKWIVYVCTGLLMYVLYWIVVCLKSTGCTHTDTHTDASKHPSQHSPELWVLDYGR